MTDVVMALRLAPPHRPLALPNLIPYYEIRPEALIITKVSEACVPKAEFIIE